MAFASRAVVALGQESLAARSRDGCDSRGCESRGRVGEPVSVSGSPTFECPRSARRKSAWRSEKIEFCTPQSFSPAVKEAGRSSGHSCCGAEFCDAERILFFRVQNSCVLHGGPLKNRVNHTANRSLRRAKVGEFTFIVCAPLTRNCHQVSRQGAKARRRSPSADGVRCGRF